ncbi:MAG: hypothetical protein MJZ26_05910 [Fibrobacter sp.]|nr:hypothetical protein [Fibrobacter sp.]
MKKRVFALVVASLAAVSFVACGDDSSSTNASNEPGKVQPSALPDTVQTLDSLLNEYKCRESYKCAHVYLVEMSNMMECDGDAWVYLSDYLPSVCEEVAEPSSSSDTQAESSSDVIEESLSSSSESSESIFEPATDCYEGGAQITISNIENLNMQCGGSTEGWTVYDKDHWTLYTCTDGDWVEEEAIPCVMD